MSKFSLLGALSMLILSSNLWAFGQNQPSEENQPLPQDQALLIDDLRVEGMFQVGEGAVAQVMSSHDNKSLLLRQGDALCDGIVKSVALGEVVFKQDIIDPSIVKPFRHVTVEIGL